MFLECHKADCFAMDLADAAAERLVEIKKNVNLGYPCCKGKGEKNPAAVGSGVDTVSCDDLPTPVLTLGESTTPFQFIWSHGHESVVADSPLHEKLLVALHGSFSTWQNVSLLAFPWVNGQSSEDEAVELLAGAFGKTGWAYANEGGGRVAGLAVRLFSWQFNYSQIMYVQMCSFILTGDFSLATTCLAKSGGLRRNR
eukprot:TRINITY_DN1031_c0_g1_i1.p1 TRINITY_DN1031_c0_g1~~TRINITY_DN1031_c0_g1_i1.p1  ORF type:complete len:198 (-),score=30.04 TRINITY_DN1031_c0_g1_i1:174-767(-)